MIPLTEKSRKFRSGVQHAMDCYAEDCDGRCLRVKDEQQAKAEARAHAVGDDDNGRIGFNVGWDKGIEWLRAQQAGEPSKCLHCGDRGWVEEGDPETGGNMVPCERCPTKAEAASVPVGSAPNMGDMKRAISEAIGFEWAVSERQEVNADDLINIGVAVYALAATPSRSPASVSKWGIDYDALTPAFCGKWSGSQQVEAGDVLDWLMAFPKVAIAAQPPVAPVAQPVAATSDQVGAFAIEVEKLLCAKLGIPWSASGISIASLIDRLAHAANGAEGKARLDAMQAEATRWPPNPEQQKVFLNEAIRQRAEEISKETWDEGWAPHRDAILALVRQAYVAAGKARLAKHWVRLEALVKDIEEDLK